MNLPDLLSTMADGRFHSGQNLAHERSVSRTAIHKAIHQLIDMGIEIDRLPGRGYRLRRVIELLDGNKILNLLSAQASRHVAELEIFAEIGSTNTYLLNSASELAPSGQVCIAECQRAGKGRRGNPWVSPFGASITLSLLWRFDNCDHRIGALSLLIAIHLARMLENAGLNQVRLKWPNDIYSRNQKLGGILLDMVGEVGGQVHIVIGIGINVAMPEQMADAIGQPWTDLASEMPGGYPSRNFLAAQTISAMIEAIIEFERDGLLKLQDMWQVYDLCYQRTVRISRFNGYVEGEGAGIDEQGRLLLKTENGLQAYTSGEVSLRLAA